MAVQVLVVLDQKIAELESTLTALRHARSALAGGSAGAGRPQVKGKPGRRRFTAAQRAEISKRMKAMWAKRRGK